MIRGQLSADMKRPAVIATVRNFRSMTRTAMGSTTRSTGIFLRRAADGGGGGSSTPQARRIAARVLPELNGCDDRSAASKHTSFLSFRSAPWLSVNTSMASVKRSTALTRRPTTSATRPRYSCSKRSSLSRRLNKSPNACLGVSLTSPCTLTPCRTLWHARNQLKPTLEASLAAFS